MIGDDIRAAARRLASEANASGSPLRWFEELYGEARAGRAVVPWADLEPNPHLVSWPGLDDLELGRALVVGCGYGDDAEWLASRGWDVTAFDIAPSAVAECRRRFRDSPVDYVAADLLAPPAGWTRFDLVVEAYTVQVMPPGSPQRTAAIASVRALTGRDLLVIARARDEDGPEGQMPWPLTEAEVRSFGGEGLAMRRCEEVVDPDDSSVRRFRAHLRRAG